MQDGKQYAKRVIEKIIDWAVPAVCAAALLVWKKIPIDIAHYWPVLCACGIGICSLTAALSNRRGIIQLKKIQEENQKKEESRKAIDDSIAKAFRAMLDDSMALLYGQCVAKGYTTEDERRRYNRLHNAYVGMEGNGEGARRKIHFDALPDEEEWKAKHMNLGGNENED